jgi:hypothetical protein
MLIPAAISPAMVTSGPPEAVFDERLAVSINQKMAGTDKTGTSAAKNSLRLINSFKEVPGLAFFSTI